MDKRILILIAVFMIGSASLFGYRKLYYKPGKIDYEISRRAVVKAGDSIEYNDKTPDARRWKWDFGDGEYSVSNSGMHTYFAPGNYNITLTAYGPFGTQTTSVIVNVVGRDILPSGLTIVGPGAATQSVPATWESSVEAEEYIWTVEGEAALAGNIQKGSSGTFTFKTPGVRTLVLKTHNPDGVTSRSVSVLASAPAPKAVHPAATPKATRPKQSADKTLPDDPNISREDWERDKKK